LMKARPEKKPVKRRENVEGMLRSSNLMAARTRLRELTQELGREVEQVGLGWKLVGGKARLVWRSTPALSWQEVTPIQLTGWGQRWRQGDIAWEPGGEPVWDWVAASLATGSDEVEWSVRLTGMRALLRRMLLVAGLVERIIGPDGSPCQKREGVLRWEWTQDSSGQGEGVLALVQPDGQAAGELVPLPGVPPIYLAEKGWWEGPVPLLDRGVLLHPFHMDAEAMQTREGAELLVRLGVPLPDNLRRHVDEVRLVPQIECSCGELFAGSAHEAVLVRLVAQDEQGRFREEWQDDRWVSLQCPEEQPDRFLLVDRRSVVGAPGWLAGLGARWDAQRGVWKVRLRQGAAEEFVAWRASLPPVAQVRMDGDLSTLFDPPVEATVHLESSPAKEGGISVDWFDLQLVVRVSDTRLSEDEIRLLLESRGHFVRIEGKGWRRISWAVDPEAQEQWADLGLSLDDAGETPRRVHVSQLAAWTGELEKIMGSSAMEAVRLRSLDLERAGKVSVPPELKANLRGYQEAGFHFLVFLAINKIGGILADDMGLGKTLQTLCWLLWLKKFEPARSGPSLVICPKSVTANWAAETAKFAPDLRVKVIHGTEWSSMLDTWDCWDLVVLNYAQLRALSTEVAAVGWRAVVCDEGQFIKNPASQTAEVVRSLQAAYRLVLTGTPIENRLVDLWSLMAFAMPGQLGTRNRFIKEFDAVGRDALATRRLVGRLRPYLLRRTKDQVAPELPPRVEEDVLCEMEGDQLTLYRAELKRAQQLLLKIRNAASWQKDRFHVLTSLLRLRQICCHPGLVDDALTNQGSAKSEALADLLEPIVEEGHKVLVFSQFVSLINLVEPEARAKGWPVWRLTGQTMNREETVAEFKAFQGGGVFFISLKAGGFGLNLAESPYVVLMDPWWNPAVEAQAIDRTHRIGQTQTVIAYRLVAAGSVEEKIRALQARKADLARAVLSGAEFERELTLDDIRYLVEDMGQ
jgi:hypothetical protein